MSPSSERSSSGFHFKWAREMLIRSLFSHGACYFSPPREAANDRMRESFTTAIERFLLGPDLPPSTADERSPGKPVGGSTSSSLHHTPMQTSGGGHVDKSISTEQYEDLSDCKKATQSITAIASSIVDRLCRRSDNEWRSALLQFQPLVGLLALCTTVACVFTSLAVLKLSNNSPVDRWPIQPTVYLAIITAVSNSAVALAWLQAQPVSWWGSAARGRSIAALERQWHMARSLVQSIRYCRSLSLLNVACLAVAFVVIDGAVRQRASTVERASTPVQIPLLLRLPPELPTGYTGRGIGSVIDPTETYSHMMRGYLNNEPVVLDVPGCPEKCHATVLGPGIAPLSCGTSSQSISRQMMRSSNATWGYKGQKAKYPGTRFWQLPAFEISLEIAPVAYQSKQLETPYMIETAELQTARLQFLETGAEYITKTCTLLPSILKYDIVIEDRKVALPQHASDGVFVDWANNTRHPLAQHGGPVPVMTIDGLTVDMDRLFNTYSMVYHHMDVNGQLWRRTQDYGSLAYKWEHAIGYWYTAKYFYYSDPTDDIIMAFNKYMLRAGALTSSWSNASELIDAGLAVNQSITGHTFPLVYKSDLRWFVGAAAIQIGTILLILPMFYGWWKLGTNLSLSPFTFALAFDSPLVKGVNSGGGARGVVEQLGDMQVKFGVVKPSKETDERALRRLVIAERHNVREPLEGERFDN